MSEKSKNAPGNVRVFEFQAVAATTLVSKQLYMWIHVHFSMFKMLIYLDFMNFLRQICILEMNTPYII